MTTLSVVICTHNPRPDYFDRCVAALAAQTLPPERWDLVIVDNASDAGKAPQADLSWHPKARVVHEAKLGKTPALIRGIRETDGSLVVSVDDDNVLDPDYLETACRIADERPYLGSWSGQCRPGLERKPPEWTKRYWAGLVIYEFERDVWSNLPRLAATMPQGAGLCVRRSVADHYVYLHDSGQREFQFDRTGTALLGGGDNDLAACACDLGLGMGLIAALRLTHLIRPERFTEDYLARLMEGTSFSSVMLDSVRGIQPVPRGIMGRITDYVRVAREKPPHRRIISAAYRGRDRAIRLVLSDN
jgi:glycosyltransferase involved in cell wall biosynthesis